MLWQEYTFTIVQKEIRSLETLFPVLTLYLIQCLAWCSVMFIEGISKYVRAHSIAQLCLILWDPMDCSLPVLSVHWIFRQEYCNWFPFSPPGDLPNPGIKPVSLVSPALAGRFFTTEPPGKSQWVNTKNQILTLLVNILILVKLFASGTKIRLIIFYAAKDGETLYSRQKQDLHLTGSDHELLIAKFRLKLNKVWKTTRLFRYDLNQILYDYTVEVTNRFKGLDQVIDRMPEELWKDLHNIVQEAVTKTTPKKKKCKKASWLPEEALHISEKRREVKGKGERERYTLLNSEFQRLGRRDIRKKILMNSLVAHSVKNAPSVQETWET